MSSQFLMLPLVQEESEEATNLGLFSLQNRKPYKPINFFKNPKDFRCIGSSQGWLAFLDAKASPFLLNPFSGTTIHLPRKSTPRNIIKVVLSAEPSLDGNFAVMIMYEVGCKTKLAFCRHGDQGWSFHQGQSATYYDVVCSDTHVNTFVALGPGPLLETWDLNKPIPDQKTIIQDSCPRKLAQDCSVFPRDLYTSQWYLALSLGQIFLVVRYIGEFVRYDGEVVYEGDTLTDYASEPLVCPYKTVDFHVYRLDLDRKNWTEVESLGDHALFLGGNQSMVESTKQHQELKGNSIYFTDDYWDRIDEDYSYGGHDMGIYKMEDGSIEPVLEFQEQRIEPPPFWICVPDQ